MSGEEEVFRWYTRARKFPQLLGKTPDGTRIPGGPYTVNQAIGFGLVVAVAAKTTWLWARFGLVTNVVLLCSVLFAVVWGLGRIPLGARNPFSLLNGLVRSVASPRTGRIRGERIRIARPHSVQHAVLVATPRSPIGSGTAATPPEPVPPTVTSAPPRALTGVQSLLAAHPIPEEHR